MEQMREGTLKVVEEIIKELKRGAQRKGYHPGSLTHGVKDQGNGRYQVSVHIIGNPNAVVGLGSCEIPAACA